jgi:hypothetical protein
MLLGRMLRGKVLFFMASFVVHACLTHVHHGYCRRTLVQALLFKHSDVCNIVHRMTTAIETFYENHFLDWATRLKI